ncbi:hypothetical protein [Streptomyces sp. NPDC005012]|uniref:hypothetical protein n=1 Tax=unclassified Streptomyces TaxID=2593676 RepID=UPI0033A11E47
MPPFFEVFEFNATVPAGTDNYVVEVPQWCPWPEGLAAVGGAAVDPASGVHATGTNLYPAWQQPPQQLFTNPGTEDAEVRVWVTCEVPRW